MKEVVLKSGTVLKADVVVAGIGNVITIETVLFLFPWFRWTAQKHICLGSFEGFCYISALVFVQEFSLLYIPAGQFVYQSDLCTCPFSSKLMQQPFLQAFSCIHWISKHFYLYVFFRRNPQYGLLEWKQTGSWFKANFGCWQGDLCWQLNYLTLL